MEKKGHTGARAACDCIAVRLNTAGASA